ncbi:MAG: hypothetical protein K1X53_17740, partial [Candidatus Sumerlaeaceae bacterium]|nr:hypothetical protein [Candidatus Sumerlaeaceae bacterium]
MMGESGASPPLTVSGQLGNNATSGWQARLSRFLFIAAIAYPFPFAFQGFELSDMGFSLTAFSTFFSMRDYVDGP